MKSDFKAKFIQHMIGRKNAEKGFTLIELLVVIIIIGILAAIALPSFLNQAAKAKQSEAKNYVGSVTRAQQSYRIENTTFAGDITSLEIGIPTETVDYKYTIEPTTGVAGSTAFKASSKDADTLRSYGGGVSVVATTGQSRAYSCQTTQPTATAPVPDMSKTTAEDACGTAKQVMR